MITCPLHGHEGMCPECFGEAMVKIGAEIQGIKQAHPEDSCHKCGGPNIIWFAPNELWNKHARDHGHNILCPICFTQLVEQHEGKATVWEVRPA